MAYEIDPINVQVPPELSGSAETLAYIETLQQIIEQLTDAVNVLDTRVTGLGG